RHKISSVGSKRFTSSSTENWPGSRSCLESRRIKATLRAYTFHKGLRLDRPEWELEDGELPELTNFTFGDDQGLLRKRRGLYRVVSTAAESNRPVLGVYRASVGGTNPHTL